MAEIGLIVGSGFRRLGFAPAARDTVTTPFGAPSSPVLTVEIAGRHVLVIARHGETHAIAPQLVNYRANLWALHEAGVSHCIGLNSVGAIAAGFAPGELAIPDQLIDYTAGRESSFAGPDGEVVHIDFTVPFDPVLRGRIAAAAAACGLTVRAGTYGVTQGPRLETAAEIDRLARDGCAMVGMTAMPEAALARELSMAYAVCALAVNYAAGRAPGGEAIHAQIDTFLESGMARLGELLGRLIPELAQTV